LTVTANQLAVDEKVIRVNGDDYWLYDVINPETNKLLQFRPLLTTAKQIMRWFLAELPRRYRLDGVEFLVDDADYLINVPEEDGCRFQMTSHGNRNAIERIFLEIERQTSSFATSYSYVEPQTQNFGSKPSPSGTIHDKFNPTHSNERVMSKFL
jgi:transposase-like protein